MAKTKWDWERRIGQRIKLRDLQILRVVVEWGSMAKAASHLAMSQSSVSEAISGLETALGVRLLDRGPQGTLPTIFADALLKRQHAVFDELMQGIRDVEFLADPTRGEVRIACPELASAGLLPAAIDSMFRQYPGIVVRVFHMDTGTLDFRELHDRKVDLMLVRVSRDFADRDLDAEILLHDPHFIVAGACSPWARRRKIALRELVGEPSIFPPNLVMMELINELFGSQGLEVPSERVNAASILLRSQFLATGRFLTVLPHSVLRNNAKTWSLKALPVEIGTRPWPLAALTLKHRTVGPAIELFKGHLRNAARKMSVRVRWPGTRNEV